MIYSKESVMRLYRMVAQYGISPIELYAAKDDALLRFIEDELFRRLCTMAESEAAILDKQDVHYKRREAENDFGGVITFWAYWQPVTELIELVAPTQMSDGLQVQHEGAPTRPLFVREYRPTNYIPIEFGELPAAIEPIEHTFYMTGWDEARRLWIYREKV